MKVSKVRFADNTPVPSSGRSDDYTKEITATADRQLEVKLISGVALLEIRTKGKKTCYIPVDNICSMIAEDEAAGATSLSPAATQAQPKPGVKA